MEPREFRLRRPGETGGIRKVQDGKADMFGYVVPDKPEMKIKEYELFRAYYCGICKSIGKSFGHVKRLALSYDAAFLAVLLSAAAGASPKFVKKRCMAHPAAKRYMARDSEIIDYASDINVLLAYYSQEDRRKDGDGPFAGFSAMFLGRAYGKLKRKYPEKTAFMEERLNDLAALEKEKCGSMDMAAEPFAKLMEEVVAYGPLSGGKNGQILRWIGYNLGKWIYLMDACDDLEKDIAGKKYNPLLYQFDYYADPGDIESFKRRIRDKVEFNLTCALAEISKGFELLDAKMNREIIENIIYMGMFVKMKKILGIGSCNRLE